MALVGLLEGDQFFIRLVAHIFQALLIHQKALGGDPLNPLDIGDDIGQFIRNLDNLAGELLGKQLNTVMDLINANEPRIKVVKPATHINNHLLPLNNLPPQVLLLNLEFLTHAARFLQGDRIGLAQAIQLRNQLPLALLGFPDLGLEIENLLLSVFNAGKPGEDLVPILPPGLGQLLNLRLHLAQGLDTLLNLDQRARDLFAQPDNIAARCLNRLGNFFGVALEEALDLYDRGLGLTGLLHGPVVLIGLIFDQPAQFVDLALEVDNLGLFMGT
jgi:hypothetical protein